MADPVYTDPIYPWTEARSFLTPDATRIEQNIAYIHDVQVPAVETDLEDEAINRSTADTSLQANIDSEASTRASADTSLQTQIDNNINQSVKTTSTPTFAGINSADATHTTLASGSYSLGGWTGSTVLTYNLRRPETVYAKNTGNADLEIQASTPDGWVELDTLTTGRVAALNPGNYRFYLSNQSSPGASGTYAIYRIGRFA